MAKPARVRTAGRGEPTRGDGVTFQLSLLSVTPWRADWEQHGDLFAEYLRDAQLSAAVLIVGAIAGVAAMLEAHWTNVEGVPPEEAMEQARQWRRRVVAHAMEIADAAEVATPMELHP